MRLSRDVGQSPGSGPRSRVVRFLKWLVTDTDDNEELRCLVCGRIVRLPRNWMSSRFGVLRVPRWARELTSACSLQNETHHSEEEVRAATAEGPWR